MRHNLLLLSLVIALCAFGAWVGLGANRGWTRTTIPVKTVDEVTGIEAIEYKKTFSPGVEALGAAICFSFVVAATSLLFKKSTNNQNENSTA